MKLLKQISNERLRAGHADEMMNGERRLSWMNESLQRLLKVPHYAWCRFFRWAQWLMPAQRQIADRSADTIFHKHRIYFRICMKTDAWHVVDIRSDLICDGDAAHTRNNKKIEGERYHST